MNKRFETALIPIKMAKPKNTDHIKFWQGYGRTGACIHN